MSNQCKLVILRMQWIARCLLVSTVTFLKTLVKSRGRQDSTEIFSEEIASFSKVAGKSGFNVFDEKCLNHIRQLTLILITAYLTISIAGVIGNSMVIWMLRQRHQMTTATYIFIVNFSVTDISVVAFCVGSKLLANNFQRQPLHDLDGCCRLVI